MRLALPLWTLLTVAAAAGPHAPAAGQPGSTAIPKNSPLIQGWATGYTQLLRGLDDIADPFALPVTWGSGPNALGPADADTNSLPVVSLGDGGSIVLTFAQPITDGDGADFAVFENGFSDNFLELAFVEVSSNGIDYLRFPALSETPFDIQVGTFGLLDPTNIHNLAGKYRRGFGTPFDLAELPAHPLVNPLAITHVRIIDVVGSIDPDHARRDSLGRIINDPYPTAFETGGFDLDAVAAIHIIPEPGALFLLLAGSLAFALPRQRGK